MDGAVSDQTDLSQHQGCVCCSAIGDVSDQIDLPQNQGWLLCSNGQGCLRSDRSSTTLAVYVVTQLSTLSQIRQIFYNTIGVSVVQRWAGLRQIRQIFHNTRGVSVVQRWAGLCQIRQIFHNTNGRCCPTVKQTIH